MIPIRSFYVGFLYGTELPQFSSEKVLVTIVDESIIAHIPPLDPLCIQHPCPESHFLLYLAFLYLSYVLRIGISVQHLQSLAHC